MPKLPPSLSIARRLIDATIPYEGALPLYRDVRVVTPFLVQLWLLATPIAYPNTLLHEPWRTQIGRAHV